MLKQLELKQLQDREQSKRELGDSKAAEDDTAKAALTVEGSRGLFHYSNGDSYEGEFRDGVRSGWGKMTFSDDGCVYEGQWVRGLHDGQGTKSWADGIEYVGEWKGGMMHGQGKYTMSDGYLMNGRFESDEFVE
mmetsp:Transcript_17896/g.30586  ORF Transcript_17896/g.30586 Transcript_17896/m.30586 type:complete len:134 (-) Transcript_17896:74-475(-)